MKLEDYRGADCTLYRTPPVDVSKVEEKIDAVLLRAWEQNNSASRAMDQVLEDASIVKVLEDQIEENLSFQRQREYENIELQTNLAVGSFEQEKAAKLEEIEDEYGKAAKAKGRQASASDIATRQKRDEYERHKTSIERKRQQIKQKFAALGGRAGIDSLGEISRYIQEDDYKPDTKSKRPKWKPYDLSFLDEDSTDLSEDTIEDTVKEVARPEPKEYAVVSLFNAIKYVLWDYDLLEIPNDIRRKIGRD